ncbi:hypothetical protein PIB30_071025 [Stylosanthes scabra]|uniref:Uncharacterized protein n=1 Tax=Stylosanthes scabra TaxID=79078 RepID=A0ABU6ZMC1_9FABA|nr:hypothetical protein [Stylosanthes scabra]
MSVIRLMIQSANSNFNNSSIASQPLNSGDLPSQPPSSSRGSIPTLFLCANQEGRDDTLLHEEDVESVNREEMHECLEEVEEENEDQEAEDVEGMAMRIELLLMIKLRLSLLPSWHLAQRTVQLSSVGRANDGDNNLVLF